MRIIAGTHRSRRLIAPDKLPVRPTTDRAKEALFSIIESGYYFDEKTVLDLYSGTGNIAYEFASRGVEKVTAIDNNLHCIKYIEKTTKELDLNITAVKSDCIKYLENCKQQFNFIFADPPYDYENYQEMKDLIINKNLIKGEGLLIIEHNKDTQFEGENVKLRKYGTVHFSIFSF
jgi:16S rRNA (guanine(966)-N(2))-methyltransferase RsmD